MKKRNSIKRVFNFLPLFGSSALILATSASCGTASVQNYRILPTYTGQADILISLGIKPDYYPLQLDSKEPFSYLINAESMMPQQSDSFKAKLGAKLRSMIPSSRGSSWWNQFALNSGERGSDPEYWTHISGDLTFYERYLLDDGVKAIDSSVAPKHFATPETFIETNFRNSRDPFTRMPEDVVHALFDEADYKKLKDEPLKQKVVSELLDAAREAEGIKNDGSLAADGKAMPTGQPNKELGEGTSWLYNDYVFARTLHDDYLESAQFNGSSFGQEFTDFTNAKSKWLLNVIAKNDWTFSSKASEELALRKLFFASTYASAEADLKTLVTNPSSSLVARSLNTKLVFPSYHHPIYEQQEDIGSAPMFEGAMRDNMLYLYNIASNISKAFNFEGSGTEGQQFLQRTFSSDPRYTQLKNALVNASKIFTELRTRMDKFKVIANKLGNPTFGLITVAPGAGSSTVQTSSKFGFIYREMGFNQPTPANLFNLAQNPEASAAKGGSSFNMDDNGWWWNLSGENELLDLNAVKEFQNTFDFGILNVRDLQWNNLKNLDPKALFDVWKPEVGVKNLDDLNKQRYDYDLWNEGLKSPIGMHMILDQFLDRLIARYGSNASVTASDWAAAKDWGSYFTNDFVK